MSRIHVLLKPILATFVVLSLFSGPAISQEQDLDRLFGLLAQKDNGNWESVEQDIWAEWSRSGSPAMDLLLQRGRLAMAEGNLTLAIEHLTALIDHAPEFAEGWNARATAYFQAGLFGPSIADIRVTLTLNPKHFGALSGLGMIMESMDLPNDALFAYRQALAIHPHRPNVINAIERLEKQVEGTDL